MNKPFSKFTKNAVLAINNASVVAERMRSRSFEPLHLFISLLLIREGIASRVLSAMRIDVKQTIESFANGIDLTSPYRRNGNRVTVVSEDTREFLSRAFSIAREHNHVYVGTEHLLLAILENRDFEFVKELVSSGLRIDDIKSNIFNFTSYPQGVLSKPS